jgi:sulfite exporter TauE/SafE
MVLTRWSDVAKRGKLPIIACTILQAIALALLLYPPAFSLLGAMVLCFAFGAGNAAHMLAFSTAADVVAPSRLGTSAAIVNGTMFIVVGIMIQRPGYGLVGALKQALNRARSLSRNMRLGR